MRNFFIVGIVILVVVALIFEFQAFHQISSVSVRKSSDTPVIIPARTLVQAPVHQESASVEELFTASHASAAEGMLQAKAGSPQTTRAVALVGEQLKSLTANDPSHYERVFVKGGGQKIPVAVSFPQFPPGTKITVESEDGGFIGDKDVVQVLPINDRHQIAFNFVTTPNDGIYRVTLRRGSELVQELQFWAGPDLVYSPRNFAKSKVR